MSRPVLMPEQILPGRPDADAALHTLQGATMGTTWAVRVAASPARWQGEAVQQGITALLDEVCRQMSHWDPASDLIRFNRSAAGSSHVLPGHFRVVMDCALAMARLSQGAYDPAAGHWIEAWGFGASRRYDDPDFVPPDAAVIDALRVAHPHGWADLPWQADGASLRQPGGAWLDLGAIAKGFAVDLVSRHLSRLGLAHHLVEIGGELRGEGVKPDGQPWWVELELPSVLAQAAEEGRFSAPILALHGLSVATSGDYRRCFRAADGRLLAHTIDPRTGWPVMHGAASVTVVHRDCMWADAWSTALLVLGRDAGLDLADRYRVPAFFVQREGDELVPYASATFEAMLE